MYNYRYTLCLHENDRQTIDENTEVHADILCISWLTNYIELYVD